MKIPIKKKYFDQIKAGTKTKEYRDAHITFINEETGEQLRKNIISAQVVKRYYPDYKKEIAKYSDVLEDEDILIFYLSNGGN